MNVSGGVDMRADMRADTPRACAKNRWKALAEADLRVPPGLQPRTSRPAGRTPAKKSNLRPEQQALARQVAAGTKATA